MKKFKMASLVISVCLLLSSFSVSAAYDKQNILKTSENVSALFRTKMTNNTQEKSISSMNLTQVKASLAKSHKTTSEINNVVLKNLGYTDSDLTTMGQEEIDKLMAETASITATEKYVKVSPSGEQTILGKQQCLLEAAQVNSKKNISAGTIALPAASANFTTTSGNSGSNDETFDGYMRIMTSCYYIIPGEYGERGWYWTNSTYVWLTTPTNRNEDGIALYCSAMSFTQDTSQFYSTFSYTENYYGTYYNHYLTKTTQDFSREQDGHGFFYKWVLPADQNSQYENDYTIKENFNFYIRGKARLINYTVPHEPTLTSQYEHLAWYLGIAPTIGFSAGGISFTGGIYYEHTKYVSAVNLNYDPNQDVYID